MQKSKEAAEREGIVGNSLMVDGAEALNNVGTLMIGGAANIAGGAANLAVSTFRNPLPHATASASFTRNLLAAAHIDCKRELGVFAQRDSDSHMNMIHRLPNTLTFSHLATVCSMKYN